MSHRTVAAALDAGVLPPEILAAISALPRRHLLLGSMTLGELTDCLGLASGPILLLHAELAQNPAAAAAAAATAAAPLAAAAFYSAIDGSGDEPLLKRARHAGVEGWCCFGAFVSGALLIAVYFNRMISS